jgi:hypothetical protein
MFPVALMLPAAEMVASYRNGVRGLRLTASLVSRRMIRAALWVVGGIVLSNPYLVISPKQTYAAMTSQFGYGGSALALPSRFGNIAVSFFQSLPMAIGELVAIIGATGLLLLLLRRHYALPILFAAFAIPYSWLVLSGDLYATIPRFAMPLIPFIAVFSAFAVVAAWRRFHSKSGKVVVALVVAATIAFPLWHDIGYTLMARQEHPISQLATWIDRNIPVDAVIGISKKSVHYKNIDFAKYTNVIELESFSSLERVRPEYVILFRGVNDFAYPRNNWNDQHGRIRQHGYHEVMHARNAASFIGIPFHERVSDQLEYEAYVYRQIR